MREAQDGCRKYATRMQNEKELDDCRKYATRMQNEKELEDCRKYATKMKNEGGAGCLSQICDKDAK